MKKWLKLASICCMVLLMAACQKSVGQQIAEQLELGQRYLTEMNYEEAVIAFQKVIELDEKNVEAYAGLGNAYEKQAEVILEANREEALPYYGMAAESYEKVLMLDPGNSQACERLIIIYKDLGDLDKLQKLLNEYQGEGEGDSLKRELENWRTCIHIISRICDSCEAGDIDNVFLLMQSDEYTQLQEVSMELGNPVFNMGEGKGLGLYQVVTEGYGSCMIYYGDYKANLRHGTGYWMGYEGGNNYRAYGQWSEDMPEGTQEAREWSGTLDETVQTRVVTGPVSQGLWNGSILWSFERKDGDVETYAVSFESGKWVILDVEEHDGEIEYIVSRREENSGDDTYLSTESPDIIERIEGIEGFRMLEVN